MYLSLDSRQKAPMKQTKKHELTKIKALEMRADSSSVLYKSQFKWRPIGDIYARQSGRL